jgi:hypothetical protein
MEKRDGMVKENKAWHSSNITGESSTRKSGDAI